MPPDPEREKAPAVGRAFTLLRTLAATGPISLSDILERTQLNKSTAYYLLRSLMAQNAVEFDESGRRYRLGIGLIELGAAASEGLTELFVARRFLAEFVERVNATVVLYQRVSSTQIMIIDKIERSGRVRISLQVGTRIPIQGGSGGRVFLAYDEPADVDTVLSNGLHAFTPKSVTDIQTFRNELVATREQGWIEDHEGFALGVSAVAAPIFGPGNKITAVAAAVDFANVLTPEVAAEYGPLLRDTCEQIGRAIAAVGLHAGADSGVWAPSISLGRGDGYEIGTEPRR